MNEPTVEELQAEFAEFKQTSQALEAELELELAEVEDQRHELENQLAEALRDVEFWRSRADREAKEAERIQTSLSEQTDALKQAVERNQERLIAAERDNDDMERTGREIEETLQHLRQKNAELLEQNAIYQAEALERKVLTEELQRARDDLRDAHDEINRLKQPKHEHSFNMPRSQSLRRVAGMIDQVSILEGRVANVGRRLVSDGSRSSITYHPLAAKRLDLRGESVSAVYGHGRPI